MIEGLPGGPLTFASSSGSVSHVTRHTRIQQMLNVYPVDIGAEKMLWKATAVLQERCLNDFQPEPTGSVTSNSKRLVSFLIRISKDRPAPHGDDRMTRTSDSGSSMPVSPPVFEDDGMTRTPIAARTASPSLAADGMTSNPQAARRPRPKGSVCNSISVSSANPRPIVIVGDMSIPLEFPWEDDTRPLEPPSWATPADVSSDEETRPPITGFGNPARSRSPSWRRRSEP